MSKLLISNKLIIVISSIYVYLNFPTRFNHSYSFLENFIFYLDSINLFSCLLSYILLMENMSRRISKDRKLQCFLTQFPKDDVKVRFQSHGTSTPVDSYKLVENVPMASMILSNSKSQIRSVQGKRMKTMGLNRLKSILKENKEVLSSKISVNKSNREHPISQSQKTSKYYRISINENELKQTTEHSCRSKEPNSSKFSPMKPSINKFLQRTQTQAFQQKQYKHQLVENTKNVKRMQKRRKCRITTQQQFEDQCTKYIEQKQKSETNELFREMNRQMKLHQKRKEPNNYYQKIRRSALKKIDYMSYNQKYYDDSEVKHLFSVVQNCNILIHKRNQNQQEKHNKRTKTQRIDHNSTTERFKHFQFTQKRQVEEDEPLNRTSISAKDLLITEPKEIKQVEFVNKQTTSKTMKMSPKERISMNQKINTIVQVCERQRKMLDEVKNGMKIFQFYCNKIDSGFAYKGKRLNNFIIGEEQG